MQRVLIILAVVVLGIPALIYLLWLVHRTLDRCGIAYARRFCTRRGFAVQRSRSGMAFDQTGVKTEFTIVEVDCLDARQQRRLIRVLVWIFGIRRVLSDELYPDSYDQQWPPTSSDDASPKAPPRSSSSEARD